MAAEPDRLCSSLLRPSAQPEPVIEETLAPFAERGYRLPDDARWIARGLVETVRNNVTIDWTLRENVRVHLRVLIKHILRKRGVTGQVEQIKR